MTTLPEASELQSLLNDAMAIYDGSSATEEKYARIYELREPFEQTTLYIKEHPKRGLFSNPYKQHKKAIKDYESILFSLNRLLQLDEDERATLASLKANTNAFKSTLLSNENIERIKQDVTEEKRKHNANAKAVANFVTELQRRETEEANAARKRTAERLRNLDAKYKESMNALLKKGGAKKTRKTKKRSKKTRKH
jgi:hypothetical protein